MSETQNAMTGWVTAGVAAIIAALSSTVAFLFKLRENENAKRITELRADIESISLKADKCEEDRTNLKTECASLRGKIELLEVKLSYIDINGTDYSHKVLEKKD